MFDGTRRLGEALNTIARFCDVDFYLIQRLVQFVTLHASPDNAALSTTLTTRVAHELGLPFDAVTGFGRDSVKVNGTATARLLVTFPSATDLLCICHTLNNTGDRVGFPEKREFMTTWLILVQNNNTATQMWKALTGTAMVGFSNIRWCSRQEVENEIALHFNSVHVLLQQLLDEGVGDATTRKMLDIFHADPLRLEVSFAAGSGGLTDLLATTYAMEGDRLEILLVYRRVESLREYGRALVDMKVGATIRKEFPGYGTFTGRVSSIDKEDPAEFVYHITYDDGDSKTMTAAEMKPLMDVSRQELRQWAITELQGAYEYLEKRLTGQCDSSYDCTSAYLVCELAQLFDPSFVAENAVDACWVQRLAVVVPLARHAGGKLVAELEGELPKYMAAATGFSCDHSDVAAFTDAVLG
ncbi:hypothetical protein CYMTET_30410 [Cymbomonas tetramitiformis]|uniref:Uncharacterized protein n=1 Tax=Cymbomonas tetramitiformis TaxID=36881 RepID=A0AAE0KU82_9CHLO|nr:hypothetical protein CYMTET_30410 [Cymbomonas tetramitiformis]